ncbi:MAG: hypothetical protein AAFR59_13770, partial [Bacteroidota bacterium]
KRKPKYEAPKSGIFHLRLDPTNGEVLQQSFARFSLERILQWTTEDEYSQQKEQATTYQAALSLELGIPNIHMSRIIQRPDGAYTIITEQHRVKKIIPLPGLTRLASGDVDPMRRTDLERNMEFTSYDLLLTTFSAEGTLLWEQIIPHRSLYFDYNESWSGYALGFDGDHLHFIFNDQKVNQDTTSSENYAFYSTLELNKNLHTVHVQVDADGNINRKTLALRSEIEVDFRPNRFFQPDEQTLIIEGARRPEDALFNLYQQGYSTRFIRVLLHQ